MRSGGRKIDAAKAEYVRRRTDGEKVNLRELAEQMGLSYSYVRNRKRDEKWDEAVPPKKRGGQKGNKNSKGKRNAAGSHKGAPPGNKNAEKDGAYSAVFLDSLTEEEKKLVAETPLKVREALEHEMKVLKFRENKILSKIADYEKAEKGAMYLSAMTEIRGKNNTTMCFSDSAFKRVQSLQEALYKVQGRIAKITDSLRALEESAARLELERQRLDILRMRASGSADVEGAEPDDLTGTEREDEK
ncbi:hypothetical protein D1159_00215 [Pseudoflavonifractor sp. 524-17]|uniref:phage terminase small subunit n=1 Tax=Pseudoflavonifractor sp. 524-17 TaxID=2304577 RepID=UPI00137B1CF9|nr:hypothetical protein [Pseudoflavonifractor sp. 524-17]